ncbi:MAG: low specificity L-threonine aldolase [Actinomycetota bacterium]
MPGPIDLRSDTVTKPSETMRRAMAEAEVGDDWFGDDPTVNRLQERAAEVTGKEAALYVATGTMANQIAVHAYVRSGHFVATEATSHIARVEATSRAVLSGAPALEIAAPSRGQLTAEVVAAALEPDPYRVHVVDLLTLENTHQVGGGSVMPLEEMRAIRKVASERDVPVHLDGARVFNACAVAGVDVSEYAGEVDAMMFSLSKGLGAPIGSMLCGPAGLIEEARRLKIVFGGAWRQAGIMAAAGLIALEDGPKRLHEDHDNARRLANGLEELLPGSVTAPETNIVFVEVPDAWEVVGRLREEDVLVTFVAGKVRMLTHVDVSAGDIDTALEAWRRVVAA